MDVWEEIVSYGGLRVPGQPSEFFGASLASFPYNQGLTLLVGAPGEPAGSQGGSVYVFRVQSCGK